MSIDDQTASAKLFAREGAAHLYLLDYVDVHLTPLVESLRKTFPSAKVGHELASL